MAFLVATGSSSAPVSLPSVQSGRNGRNAGCLGRNTARAASSSMDALSDLLRVLRFSGGLFLETKFRAPWCVRAQISPEDCGPGRSEEHTSELQSRFGISYAVFCLKKKK